jgi:phage-related protein
MIMAAPAAVATVGQILLDVGLDTINLKSQLNGVSSTIKKTFSAQSIAGFVKVVSKAANECIGLGSDLSEVQNVVDVSFSKMSNDVNNFAKNAKKQFGLSETSAKKYVGTLGSMANSFGFAEKEAFDMSTTLTGLAGDIASFKNISQDEAFNKIKAVFTGETEGLKELGVVMTQTALNEFALQQGMNKTIQQMTEAEKVNLRYLYVLDALKLASGDFSRTSTGWANQMRVLNLTIESIKANLGQAFISILNTVLVQINTFIAKLEVASQYVKAFTESVFGKQEGNPFQSTGASEEMENIASSAGTANKQTKALQKTLMGFDKITKVSSSKSAKSGGASGVSSLGSSSNKQVISPDVMKLPQWLQDLEQAWKSGDFTNIGKNVANKISECLNKIEWKKIKDGAKKIATSIATFLNGFLGDEEMWRSLGTTIAEGLNTALTFINTFLTTTNFEDIGSALGEGINQFIEDMDWEQVGAYIINGLSAACEFVVGLLGTIEWSKILGALFDMFKGGIESEGANWQAIGTVIMGFIKAGIYLTNPIAALPLFLSEKIGEMINSIGPKLQTTLGNFFSNIFAQAVQRVQERIDGIKNILLTLYNIVYSTFSDIAIRVGDVLTNTIKGAINAVLSTTGNAINGFVNSINGAITTINNIPGVNISSLSPINIPKLANGGYVKANQPRLAIIGDNRRYGEIVANDKQMQKYSDEAYQRAMNSGAMSKGQIVNNIYLDGELIYQDIKNISDSESDRFGTPQFA